ncbi:MAG: MBL fold metallo-hydrolase [Dehalococcoidia bacterium]|nr:MBL fold metallo-hydrolase [Dehalococcoidia bacterium]MDH4299570.1 MBL fold metallo-hydrolase [Dehalococcoidia bacterium]MDH4366606.1 MBL fold metallo-hydrolase [Dehalococcoidia bacterium]
MDITWLGHSCFLIRGKEKAIITDPCHPDLGYRLGNPEADIVTLSHFHRGHCYVEGVANDPRQIRSPGEYEIGGTFITGIASFHDNKKGEVRGKNTIYVFEMDGMTLCHLGDLGHPLDSHLIEEIGDIGILFLPVGEASAIPIDTAMEIIRQLEPSVVIPMHYKTEVFAGNLSPVDKFLDTMRIKELEAKPKLSITSSSLPSSTQTIVLSHA